MSGYIKYFDNEGKNMSRMIEDDSVLVKYNDIWNKITNMLSIKIHSMSVYDENYKKTKLKEFDGVVNTNFWGDEEPKEGVRYTCEACIIIDSVM